VAVSAPHGGLVAVGRDRPDHEDVQGEDDQRPERVVGEEPEHGHGTEQRQHDRHGPGPGSAGQQADARAGDDQPEDQVDPAPGGLVELEQVLLGGDVEVVVEDRHQAGDGLEHADHEHHHGGEQDETDRQAAGLPPAARRLISPISR
jgi:hypothetical protein